MDDTVVTRARTAFNLGSRTSVANFRRNFTFINEPDGNHHRQEKEGTSPPLNKVFNWQYRVSLLAIIRRFANIARRLDRMIFLSTIFVSHSRHLRSKDVTKTAIHLARRGHYVIDYRDTLNDTEEIEYCDIFMIFYSQQYCQSLRCARELADALKFKKQIVLIKFDKYNIEFPVKNNLTVEYHKLRQWDSYIENVDEAVMEALPVRTRSERNLNEQDLKSVRGKDLSVFKACDTPVFTRYYRRKEDEIRILGRLKNMCKAPESGALVISGNPGSGKTTLLGRVLTSKNNAVPLLMECKIHFAIWINCNLWSDDSERSNFSNVSTQNDFVLKVVEAARQTDSLLPSFASLPDLTRYFQNTGRRPVLVLDDVTSPKLLMFVRSLAPSLPIIVICRNHSIFSMIPDCVQINDEISTMSNENLFEMFEKSFGFGDKLSRDKIIKLVEHCHGSPMVANLVAARFNLDVENGEPNGLDLQFNKFITENVQSKFISLSVTFEKSIFFKF